MYLQTTDGLEPEFDKPCGSGGMEGRENLQ